MTRNRFLSFLSIILIIGFLMACSPAIAEEESSSREYLLVTLDEVYIKDATDAGGEGEITIWTLVEEIEEDSSGFRKVKDSKSQANAFPHPSKYWLEANKGETIYPQIPLYMAFWDETPQELFIHIDTWDNDAGPTWISDAITGLADLLVFVGGGTEEIAKYVLNLPAETITKVTGKSWFLTKLINAFFRKLLDKIGVYEHINPAQRYARIVKAIGELTALWGKYIDSPDNVSALSYRSSEIYQADRDIPVKANDWGLKRGEESASYYLCNMQTYEAEKMCSEKPFAKITFRRVSEPSEPVNIQVTLNQVYIDDDREDLSNPEIFIHTRYTEGYQKVFEIPGGPDELLNRYRYKGDTYFLTSEQRLPSTTNEESGFYNIAEDIWFPINRKISPSSEGFTTTPFFFVEVNMFEDDSGAVAEDSLDWLSSNTWFFISEDLRDNAPFCQTSRQSKYAAVEICINVTSNELVPTAMPTPWPTMESPLPAVYYVGFNTIQPPFDNPQIRSAFAASIDRYGLLDTIGWENRQPATSFVPPSIWPSGYDLSGQNGFDFDPQFALENIESTALDGDTQLPDAITFAVSDIGANPQIAEYLKSTWEGIFNTKVEVQVIGSDQYFDYLAGDANPHMYLLGWRADYLSPYNFLYDTFSAESTDNHSHYDNPYYESLLKEALATESQSGQMELFLAAEKILCIEDAVIAPLYYYTSVK